jgi:hypothetical protein
VASAAFFRVVGDAGRLPWLVVVLSLIYVGYLVRRDPLLKRHPCSKEDAFREASFAFGFTSLLMFAFGNFGTPELPHVPLRAAVTMGLAWGVVAYRLARGFPQSWWRLLVTLVAVGLPVTVLWVIGAKLLGD